MQQTKYCSNVIMTSVSVRKNKQIKTLETDATWHEAYIILTRMNVRLTTYVSQGSAATDLRGGDSFNSSFLRRSFLKLTVKKF